MVGQRWQSRRTKVWDRYVMLTCRLGRRLGKAEAGMEGEAVGVVDRINGVVTNLGGVLTSGELAKKLGIPEPELDPAVLAGGVTGIGGTLANKGVGTGTEPEDAATDSVVSFVVVSRGVGLEGLLVSNGVGAVLEDLLSENGRAAMGGSFALEASCLIGET